MTFDIRCITFVPMKDQVLVIRADQELKKRLQEMAAKDHRTVSDFIRLQLEKITGITK